MNPATKIILIGVIACALAAGPTILLALVYFFPESWRRVLHDNQTIFGSLATLFAAGIALAGVWMTVNSQARNVEKQLQTQKEQFEREWTERRTTEDRLRTVQQRQMASAFIGEINVIKEVFGGADWKDVATKALENLKHVKPGQPVTLNSSRPTADYATFFRANAREVGQFPQPIPRDILTFYGVYAQLQDNLTQVSRASDEDFKRMPKASLEHALNDQVAQLDALQSISGVLIPELEKIANLP